MTTPCWMCLLRPSLARPLSRPPRQKLPPVVLTGAAQLSTTSHHAAKKAASGPRQHIVLGKALRMAKFKKNRDSMPIKSPLPGERKAFRKRIQLSSNNALRVEGLPTLESATMIKPESVGKIFSIPNEALDQLRAVEAFKHTQTWSFFRDPSFLVRSETVDLVKRLDSVKKEKQNLRMVLTGERIAGKSMLLLQAMTHAYMNNWVVFHIPEAQELTTACTEYAPIPKTNPILYMQHAYARRILLGIRKANETVLSKIPTLHPHQDLPQHLAVGSPLINLLKMVREADTAWPIFIALWRELATPWEGRPPLMFVLDGLPHIMKMSAYRNAAFQPIHSFDLAIVRIFVECLSGARFLPNGGAVLAATTRNNMPKSPSMELALAQHEAAAARRAAIEAIKARKSARETKAPELSEEASGASKASEATEASETGESSVTNEAGDAFEDAEDLAPLPEIPQPDPYFRGYDELVEQVLKDVDVMPVRGVSKTEARALIEYWAASGVLRCTVDERSVSEKWALGGNGIIGEMERAALLTARL